MTAHPAPAGIEFLVDACGCDLDALAAQDRLELILRWIIDDLDLPIVNGPVWQTIGESGRLSGEAALEDAHVSVHTYPAAGLAAFNLYASSTRISWAWNELLLDLLGARRIDVRVVLRGGDGMLRRGKRRTREVRSRHPRLRLLKRL
jgi:S-adenosylmethionine decarboxylase